MSKSKNALKQGDLHLSKDLGPQTSGHAVDFNSYTQNASGKKTPWITKYNKHEGKAGVEASILEVGFSQVAEACIKPGLTPPARLVVNDKNEVIGVASEKFDSQIATLREKGQTCFSFDPKTWTYEPITDSSDPKKKGYTFLDKTPENFFAELLKKHDEKEVVIDMASLASILTASYFMEEDDLHKGNIGFYVTEDQGKKKFTFYKIDHDLMFTDSIMSQKDMRLANIGYDKDSFRISVADLEKFPDLKDSGNHYWPTKHQYMVKGDKAYSGAEERAAFAKLGENPEFNDAKWKYFLKYTLMPNEMLEQTLLMHLDPKEDADKINTIKNSFWSRTAHLKQELAKCPDFITYLNSGKAEIAMAEIQQEYAQYLAANELTVPGIQEKTKANFDAFKECVTSNQSMVAKAIALDAYTFGKNHKATPADVEAAVEKFNHHIVSISASPEDSEHHAKMAFKTALIAMTMAEKSKLTIEPKAEEAMKDHMRKYAAPEMIDSLEKFKQAADRIRAVDIPLKEQKNQMISLLKNAKLDSQALGELKKELSQNEPTSPSLKFINQLRSDLWIVRKIKGTYGKTSTTNEMLDIIDSKISHINRINCQNFKQKMTELKDSIKTEPNATRDVERSRSYGDADIQFVMSK